MQEYRTFILTTVIVILTVFSGVLHGRLSGRWGGGTRIEDAAKELAKVPDDFGDWQLQDVQPLSDTEVTMLECVGHFHRIYVHRHTGESVNVAVILGPAGPVSVHTPEICFSSRNYESQDRRRRTAIMTAKKDSNEVWSVDFHSKDVDADVLRVYYGWNRGNGWSAPEHPRVSMSGSPYLYKLQLVSYLPPGIQSDPEDTGRKFLEEFIPFLDKYVIAP